jgi:hypothetical protein
MFAAGVLQSAFWHRFAMTAHSPVGLNPDAFQVKSLSDESGTFANNERAHDDPTGADHDRFAEGLRRSLFNYMHGVGFEIPLKEWFDFKTPSTTISKKFITDQIQNASAVHLRDQQRIIWIGTQPELVSLEDELNSDLVFSGKKEDFAMELPHELGVWVADLLALVSFTEPLHLVKEIRENYENELGDFDELTESEVWEILKENGLLIL